MFSTKNIPYEKNMVDLGLFVKRQYNKMVSFFSVAFVICFFPRQRSPACLCRPQLFTVSASATEFFSGSGGTKEPQKQFDHLTVKISTRRQ